MQNRLPKLNNQHGPRRPQSAVQPTLYSLRSTSPKKAQFSHIMPAQLLGSQIYPRLSRPNTCRKSHAHFPVQNLCELSTGRDLDLSLPIRTTLFGYCLKDPAPSFPNHTLQYEMGSFRSVSSANTDDLTSEKTMLTTFARPPPSCRIPRVKPSNTPNIVVPSLTDVAAVPVSTVRARPNSARKFDTFSSNSLSPSPSCLSNNFLNSNNSHTHFALVNSHAPERWMKESESVSIGNSALYSLGICQDSPHVTETPLYDLPTQFLLRSTSPLYVSPRRSQLNTPNGPEPAEASQSPAYNNSSPFSIALIDSSETLQGAVSYVTMDQTVYCKRPTTTFGFTSTAKKLRSQSQGKKRRCLSAQIDTTVKSSNPTKRKEDYKWIESETADKGKILRPIQFTIETAHLCAQDYTPANGYNFRFSVRQNGHSMSNSKNLQSPQVKPITDGSRYIHNFLDRRGFHPYSSHISISPLKIRCCQ